MQNLKTALPIRSNAPISIFKEEGQHMTKKQAQAAADQDADQKQAAMAAKPTAPTVSPLEKVIATQKVRKDDGIVRHFRNRILARIAAEQNAEEAFDQVFAQYHEFVADSLQRATATEPTPAE